MVLGFTWEQVDTLRNNFTYGMYEVSDIAVPSAIQAL